MQQAQVTSKQEIERLLKHGLAPITDNAAALVDLGFCRAYPSAVAGFEATVWERSVDRGYRQTDRGLRRVLVCERAYLVPAEQR